MLHAVDYGAGAGYGGVGGMGTTAGGITGAGKKFSDDMCFLIFCVKVVQVFGRDV